ncbi:hypothetical protein MHBO_000278 [Bonamia ostreae]|uniref:Uncharacterized protein n=1 Tax=Bonamia ostreae TaxID=126728 RepID=A0ABV2AF19_9EUKA
MEDFETTLNSLENILLKMPSKKGFVIQEQIISKIVKNICTLEKSEKRDRLVQKFGSLIKPIANNNCEQKESNPLIYKHLSDFENMCGHKNESIEFKRKELRSLKTGKWDKSKEKLEKVAIATISLYEMSGNPDERQLILMNIGTLKKKFQDLRMDDRILEVKL